MHLSRKKSVFIFLMITTLALYGLKTRSRIATIPTASIAPSPITTTEERQSKKIFIWAVNEIPDNNTDFNLYKVTKPITDFESIYPLIQALSFSVEDLIDDSISQKLWSNNQASLSIGTTPQYFIYTSSNAEGTNVNHELLFSILREIQGISISIPKNQIIDIFNPQTGIKNQVNATLFDISQKVNGVNVVTNSKQNIGSIVFFKDTNNLLSFDIAGGYREINIEGKVTSLTFEELTEKAENSAILVGNYSTVGERKSQLLTEQIVTINNIELVYYIDQNDDYLRPGYLVSGNNQDSKKLTYFVPAQ